MHPPIPSAAPHQDPLYRQARKRVEMKMGFLVHLSVFVLVNAGLALLALLGGGSPGWPFPLGGWALGLVIHGCVTLLSLQGAGLRERLLAQELQALRQR